MFGTIYLEMKTKPNVMKNLEDEVCRVWDMNRACYLFIHVELDY